MIFLFLLLNSTSCITNHNSSYLAGYDDAVNDFIYRAHIHIANGVKHPIHDPVYRSGYTAGWYDAAHGIMNYECSRAAVATKYND